MINKFTDGNTNKDRVLIKSDHFENNVIITNGFNASGKTLYSPIISSIKNVEVMSFLYEMEWASSLFYSGEISTNSYKEFIHMSIDHLTYNQQMSRCTNFRINDLSSALKNHKRLKYLLRLFIKGDNDVLLKIKNNKPITNITTCHLFPFYPTIKDALQKRLLFIETIRDPLYMFNQLLILQKTVIKDRGKKDFTFRVKYGDTDLTYLDYYTKDSVFIESKNISDEEFVINYLERMSLFYTKLDYASLNKDSNLIIVPFEHFVINPYPYLDRILKFCGANYCNQLRRQLKKQKVPRKLLRDGISLNIYKRFGWDNNTGLNINSLTEEDNFYKDKISSIINNKSLFNRLLDLSFRYRDFIKQF